MRFHHKDIVGFQLEFLATSLALSCLKVVFWQLHFLSSEECRKLLVDERDVQSMDAFVVELTILISGVF